MCIRDSERGQHSSPPAQYPETVLDVIRLGFSSPLPEGDHHEEFGLPSGPVDFRSAWDIQRRLHAQIHAGDRGPTLLLLEHRPVYTAGKLTADHERPRDGAEVIDIDRGGKITWHGPHQLVGYPLVPLPIPIDVVGFVRSLEQALIAACADLGVATCAVDGRSGVWVRRTGSPDEKIAAIGLRVSKRITMHGFALNCANDLTWAQNVIPCGIEDAGVTSLSAQLGRTVDVPEVLPVVERHVAAAIETVAQRT